MWYHYIQGCINNLIQISVCNNMISERKDLAFVVMILTILVCFTQRMAKVSLYVRCSHVATGIFMWLSETLVMFN